MNKYKKLSNDEIQKELDRISKWDIKKNKLHREYEFSNFVQAFGFMSQVALVAEKLDHHPEWSNIYKNVEINLTTHAANGITDFDFKLAASIENIYSSLVNKN
jgi:4a-hydroxytetrahydrobiopterin dehydratase